ncbi:hypothetical protein GRI97_16020 [Altererythrobacter xixiisoli]|uniref:Uncharacterized protein n=1 Tax=Croceibacterium xixiisoli TaxID=1476466 RepID=A0A6I4TWU0_9SPHN|nr:hypothetical protein [Croceibacterium xixiisoli]MXP00497.1 hypothetical protein [Croceibacterium xixiisoli]
MTRIHRHIHDPVFPEGVAKARKSVLVDFDGECLEVRYYRTLWHRLHDDANAVKRRQTSALIVRHGQHVGSLEFTEYQVATFTDSREFFMEMDNHSQAAYGLARVICESWNDVNEISNYGDIVEMNRAWMSLRFYKRGCFSAAANALIDKLFDGGGIFILKAFPLEYEGDVTKENAKTFLRRQSAMKRHYKRVFGVASFPGMHGGDGWMYSMPKRLIGFVPNPSEGNNFDYDSILFG